MEKRGTDLAWVLCWVMRAAGCSRVRRVGGVGGVRCLGARGEVEAEAGRVLVLIHQLDCAVQVSLALQRDEDLGTQRGNNRVFYCLRALRESRW